jgi:hypothetical protein
VLASIFNHPSRLNDHFSELVKIISDDRRESIWGEMPQLEPLSTYKACGMSLRDRSQLREENGIQELEQVTSEFVHEINKSQSGEKIRYLDKKNKALAAVREHKLKRFE